MDLLTSNVGLMIWQILILLHLVGIILAIVQLYQHRLPFQTKTIWCFIVLVIPLGWLVYLVFRKQLHQTKPID